MPRYSSFDRFFAFGDNISLLGTSEIRLMTGVAERDAAEQDDDFSASLTSTAGGTFFSENRSFVSFFTGEVFVTRLIYYVSNFCLSRLLKEPCRADDLGPGPNVGELSPAAIGEPRLQALLTIKWDKLISK